MSIQPESARLLSALEQGRASVRAPGVIAGLAITGQAPITAAAGTADVESRQALFTTDRLRVGSVTKTFTATAVLQLAEALSDINYPAIGSFTIKLLGHFEQWCADY